MKRKDLISKLMTEGFTEKTLVNMSDKQLKMLSDRIIPEQYVGTIPTSTSSSTSNPVVKVPLSTIKSNPEQARKLANANIPFAANEEEKKTGATWGDVFKAMDALKDARDKGKITQKEFEDAFKKLPKKKKPSKKDDKKSDVKEEKLGAEKKEKEDKDIILQRVTHRMDSKMKKGDCIKAEVELLKRMDKSVPEKYQKYVDKKTSSLKEWVDKVVQKNHRPFTSKNEIMELVQVKLNEQFKEEMFNNVGTAAQMQEQPESDVMEPPTKEKTATFDDVLSYDKLKQIAGKNELIPGINDYIQSLGYGSPQREVGEPEIETGEPDVEEDEPVDPFNPGPGVDPGPKAGMGSPQREYPDVEPDVHPGKPDTEEDEPYDPFNPGPGIDPNPKAKKETNIR